MFQAGLTAFRNDQIHRSRADELDVGPGGVEVRIVGDGVPFLAGHGKQDALGSASLVSWDDVFVSDNVLNGATKTIEAAAAGVTLIAFHDCRPLVRGHGARAGVREEVNQDIIGWKEEKVVIGGA